MNTLRLAFGRNCGRRSPARRVNPAYGNPCRRSWAIGVAAALLTMSGEFATNRLIAADKPHSTWLGDLPPAERAAILWQADYEAGDLAEWRRPGWRHPGAGEFNTPSETAASGSAAGVEARAEVVAAAQHSGRRAAATTIRGARRGAEGAVAVRLMAWTDRPWDDGGRHFPTDAYYSTWIMAPHAYRPEKDSNDTGGDGGWWNVFQFKSEDRAGASQPVWIVNIASAGRGAMEFYLYSPVNQPATVEQIRPRPFAPGQWVHLEVRYQSRPAGQGQIDVFQDGVHILGAAGVTTSLGGSDGRDHHPIWGIGNYADHIAGDPRGEGVATLYFDDSAVAARSLGRYALAARPQDPPPAAGSSP